MAILSKLNGVPIFNAINEALAWGKANRLSGYHVHYWQGQKGYMGGADHSRATKKQMATRAPIAITEPTTPTIPPVATRRVNTNIPQPITRRVNTNISQATTTRRASNPIVIRRTGGGGGGY